MSSGSSSFHRPSFSLGERPSSARGSSGAGHTHTLSQHMNSIHANSGRIPKSSISASSGSTGSPRPSTSSGILQNVAASFTGSSSIGSSGSLNKMKDGNSTDEPVTKEINGTSTPVNPSAKPAPFPYPLSKDLRVIGMDVLDHAFLMQCRKTVTWLDFGMSPPKRSLDLGCGTGAWVIDAAKQWKDCHFTGFDMHNMQPKLGMLPRQLAERIQWVQGNFRNGSLEKLPFEDNSFDHIHLFRVAWGVPEGTFDALLAEIERILKPGGALEWVEEDLVFPRIPRSYTTKPKQRPAGHYSRISQTLEIPPTPIDETASLPHAHALLESLFFGVFETRMINPRPIMILPHYLNTYFKHVLATNEQSYPFPPPPIPRRTQQSHNRESSPDHLHTPQHSFQVDQDRLCAPVSPDLSAARPRSQSESSQMSSLSSISTATTTTLASSNSSQLLLEETLGDTIPLPPQPPYAPTFGVFHPVSGGSYLSIPLLRPIGPVEINHRHLALYLNTAYTRILACRDAMWLELVRRLRGKEERQELRALGWDEEGDEDAYEDAFGGMGGAEMVGVGTSGGDASDADNAGDGVEGPPNSANPGGPTPIDQQQHMSPSSYSQSQTLPQALPRPSPSLIRARARFEEFLSRFERDMRLRTSLSDTVQQGLKWQKPRSFGPVNKYEKAREIEMEGLVAEAARAEVEARLRGGGEGADGALNNAGVRMGLGNEDGGPWAVSRRFRGFVGIKAESTALPTRR